MFLTAVCFGDDGSERDIYFIEFFDNKNLFNLMIMVHGVTAAQSHKRNTKKNKIFSFLFFKLLTRKNVLCLNVKNKKVFLFD